MHADWVVLGLTVGRPVVTVIAIAVSSGALGRFGTTPPARAAVDRREVGRAAPGSRRRSAIGSRLAVEPGRGRRAVPVRSALIGAIVGVLGVVGCFTFRAGLADAAASPQRSGIVWDYVVASGDGAVPAEGPRGPFAGDNDVAAVLHAVWVRNVRINGVTTPTFGIET